MVHPFRLGAAVVAGLLLVPGLQSPARAAKPPVTRVVSAKLSARSGAARSTVTFTGKVTRSPTSSIVRVQRKVGTTWVVVRTTRTTTRSGAYSVKVTLPATAGRYAFRAAAPAKGDLRAAVSKALGVDVLATVAVTLRATPATVPAGGRVTLSGTVKPFDTDAPLTLQKQVNGRWIAAGSTPIRSNGTFSTTVLVGPTTPFRAMAAALGFHALAFSPVVTVTTTPVIATTVLPAATLGQTYRARMITIDGSAGTWTAAPLPEGLELDPATGVISGTPTEVGTTEVAVGFTATGSGATAPAARIPLTVRGTDPSGT